jgi:O-antigen/teichoic acid export membrane protein
MSKDIAPDESTDDHLDATTLVTGREHRRPLRDVLVLWGARVIASLSTISVLGLAARSLSIETFAQFALLVGLIGWLPVFDFGFGSVMQNRIAQAWAHGLNDTRALAGGLVGASGFAAVSGLSIILGVSVWGALSGSSGIQHQLGVIALTVTCLMVSGVSMTVHKVYAATNRLVRSAIVSALQNLFSLVGLWLVLLLQPGEPSLEGMLAGYFLPYTIVPLFALLQVVYKSGWPRDWATLWRERTLVKEALQFWFVLLLSLTVIQFDQFIAFTYLSPVEYSHYAVASKLINFIYFPYSALLTANWSRVSVAHAKRDRTQVISIVRSSFLIGIFYITVALALLLTVTENFSYLLPSDAGQIQIGLLIGIGLVALNKVWTESYSLVYLATGNTSIIAAYLPVQAGIAVGMQFVLVQFIGAYGLMLGGALSYFMTSHWILYSRTRDVIGT